MEQLKATDLMPMDIVRHKRTKEIIGIFEIDEYRNIINNEADGYCSETNISVDDIEPIDLTSEIFQANGFKVDSGYAILDLGDGKWLEYYFYEHRLTMYYEGTDEWQNHSQVRDIVCRCQCHYVHQLQQALRQWYLKDMANNFKLK